MESESEATIDLARSKLLENQNMGDLGVLEISPVAEIKGLYCESL
jgi:hypothetical protein